MPLAKYILIHDAHLQNKMLYLITMRLPLSGYEIPLSFMAEEEE